ncbi:hypothetical protein [Novosphingobium sp. fls2-241-R2A-195]|uniref:hypothetical protein n=1 Tax=Novosphingobium sp. fls2-241-R2A-195 TaxID=3040296 RepID=UPI00254BAEBE|nr:hypothetical protein [Novosphingobium sp. fls2-241-R2A-195]
MTDFSADKLRALDEGPQLQRIMFTCEGCKHLTTEDWVEYPDGERDSDTSAWCNAGEKRNLTAYWSAGNQPPSWCPFPVPSILAIAEREKRKDAEIARLQEVEDRAWREARELVIGSNADLGGGSGLTYRRIISGLTAAIHNRELRTLSGRVADLIARRALGEEKS